MEDKPTCETCKYSRESYTLECRIKPPSPDYKSGMRTFPRVSSGDWCAKHTPKEQIND
jgi:hypothetical protein